MRTWLAGGLGVLLLVGGAFAQDANRAHLVTTLDATAVSDHFPVIALARGISGRAVLQCRVAADGSSQCVAIEEAPANMGFGAAAAALAQDWRFTPQMENGRAVASSERIAVNFLNEQSDAVPIRFATNVDGVRGAAAPTGDASAAAERYYPERAQREDIDGRALIACAVRSDNRLECAVEREYPEGYGFGERAVALFAQHVAVTENTPPGFAMRHVVDFALHDPGAPNTARNYYSTRPRAADYARYFPRGAMEAEVGGVANLACTVREDATMNCAVISDSPTGYGFGAAALRISESFRLNADELGKPGHAPGDRVFVPITFRVGSSHP